MATQAMPVQGIGGRGRSTESVAEHNALLMATQLRCRRGPTPEALFTKRLDNSRLVKAADPQRSREMRSFAFAMVFLLSLALLYGWQHFLSIRYGYTVEAEKQQVRQLEEQNRELRLTEAQLASPARIDIMARQLGLTAPRPGQVVLPNGAAAGNGVVMADANSGLPAIH